MGKAGVIAITAAIALIVGLSLVERAADTGNVTLMNYRARHRITH